MALLSRLELPLLRRELTEQAQRKRTYALRSAAAIVLLAAVWFGLYAISEMLNIGGLGPAAALGVQGATPPGTGGILFSRMVPILFLAIPILSPALCATAFAAEKEQNTFGNLLLTRLSPTTIIVEKLLSRLVPMLTLLLLVSPVLAWLYSLGGVDPGMMSGSIVLMFSECLLYASLSLLLSAWFPSSVATFVWAYIASVILLIYGLYNPVTGFGAWLHSYGASWLTGNMPSVMAARGAAISSPLELFKEMAQDAVFPAGLALVLLLVTRIVLVRRAFAGHSSFLITLFRALDKFFQWLNQRTTGGIELVGESAVLPDDDPVTWRERNKKSLGQFRWLVRVLVVLEFPTLFICALAVQFSRGSWSRELSVLLALLWITAAVLAAVKGASLFSQERSRQTLEPLLSCTLTSRELMQQKVVGTNRLLLVVSCPLLSVYITNAYMTATGDWMLTLGYLTLSVVLMFCILRTVVWVTAAVGTWVKSPTRAISASLTIVTLLSVLTMLPSIAISQTARSTNTATFGLNHLLSGIGPVGAIADVETAFLTRPGRPAFPYSNLQSRRPGEKSYVHPALVVGPALLLHVLYLFLARTLVLRLTPWLLQRPDSVPVDDFVKSHPAVV